MANLKDLWLKLSKFWRKNIERAIVVFTVGFTSALVLPAITDATNLAAWKAAVGSAVMAGLSALMGMVTKNMGADKNSPATQ